MQLPENAEELRVWPLPTALAGIGILGLFTLERTTVVAAALLLEQGIDWFWTLLLFPLVMGVVLAVPLAGRYWLGMFWAAVLCYLLSLLIRWAALLGILGDVYLLLLACSLMFLCQSLLLLLKRCSLWFDDGNRFGNGPPV
ncbi:hypothetical protein [Parathalassolituus penaei]|uniref:Uncharacterized protein n=1 Tax=Parathalassolituus penaei TaxID=2997323 RepID=A0A9X3IQT6_9GAMM|nr:hypothetical protein [Parathalassolituus penaei]MCY0964131.1 hypothetical protein [Parathalassolituus penaei]